MLGYLIGLYVLIYHISKVNLSLFHSVVKFINWMHYLYTNYYHASKQNLSKLYFRDL